MVWNFHLPSRSGEKRTFQVLPPSQNPRTTLTSPAGEVNATFSVTSSSGLVMTVELLNEVSNTPNSGADASGGSDENQPA